MEWRILWVGKMAPARNALLALLLVSAAGISAAQADDRAFERNNLGGSDSAFLQQHADNPIHWQRWTPATLDYARRSAKPIFLSVGYSACYWCHVMERESFSDAATADYLNRHFVSILVDREARPDIDYLYQNALYALTGGGGWPLNMFLDSDGAPFWGGTYFPNVERQGAKPFRHILELIVENWRKDRSRITAIGAEMRKLAAAESDTRGTLTPKRLNSASGKLLTEVDDFYGGFGSAPKYPNPQALEVLWRAHLRGGGEAYKEAVLNTLRRISRGGLFDHLRGGFARYASDPSWRQPHFEKMLYTNAFLIRLLSHAGRETGDASFDHPLTASVDFVLREMRASGGAFGSTLDAETGAEEGRYYLWSAAEVDEILAERSAMFRAAYDVTEEGTFEPEAIWLASDYQRAASVLSRTSMRAADLARIGGIPEADVETELAADLRLLRARREKQRAPPAFDDKVQADWNGAMIRALAEAGFARTKPGWIAAAARAFQRVGEVHGWRDGHGHARLRHASGNGVARRRDNPALVEDYAMMSLAALALFEAGGEERYLSAAQAWAETAMVHYRDGASGGFFQGADDEAGLVVRLKAAFDGEMPAGSAAMTEALAKLYYFTGKAAYRDAAEAALTAQGGGIENGYFALASLLNAADTLFGSVQVVIVGGRDEATTLKLLRAVHGLSLPNRVLQVIAPGHVLPESHPARYKEQMDGRATAYVCVGQICSLPATTASDLLQTLMSMRRR